MAEPSESGNDLRVLGKSVRLERCPRCRVAVLQVEGEGYALECAKTEAAVWNEDESVLELREIYRKHEHDSDGDLTSELEQESARSSYWYLCCRAILQDIAYRDGIGRAEAVLGEVSRQALDGFPSGSRVAELADGVTGRLMLEALEAGEARAVDEAVKGED
jgi:hypothetical protein